MSTKNDDLLKANTAYYNALRMGDFDTMSRLWAEDGVSCIHPGWPPLIGRRAVLDGWKGILRGADHGWVDFRNPSTIVNGNEGRVVCVEMVSGNAFAVTNFFRLVDGAWLMTHHQASPIAGTFQREEPEEKPRFLN